MTSPSSSASYISPPLELDLWGRSNQFTALLCGSCGSANGFGMTCRESLLPPLIAPLLPSRILVYSSPTHPATLLNCCTTIRLVRHVCTAWLAIWAWLYALVVTTSHTAVRILRYTLCAICLFPLIVNAALTSWPPMLSAGSSDVCLDHGNLVLTCVGASCVGSQMPYVSS
ncbi:hypothetical protein JVT61DRAFT_3347 [Boletus reticuloceps]|uniref:Uncharacterized protein n=1 Tax=Boletus reticuloceps TaxID=495285 RepID=A0A8I3AA46_9AGAM|nr:hypothetical protein JVT61DRAFT_3347 [Boletus reticuloceps]